MIRINLFVPTKEEAKRAARRVYSEEYFNRPGNKERDAEKRKARYIAVPEVAERARAKSRERYASKDGKDAQRAYLASKRDDAEFIKKRSVISRRWYANHKSQARELNKSYSERSWHMILARSARGNAKRKGRECSIVPADLLELWDKQSGRCYWTGIKLSVNVGHWMRVSPDRLNNALGYVKGNVVLCGAWINEIRATLSVDEFRSRIEEVRRGGQ